VKLANGLKEQGGKSDTLTNLIDSIRPELEEIRSAKKEVDTLSSQANIEIGEDINQKYQTAVKAEIENRIDKQPELKFEAVQNDIHTQSSDIYDKLVNQVGDIGDATDDMTVDNLKPETKDALNKFFAGSGTLGSGMTGSTLDNTRLSSVLQRVRLIRDNTKSKMINQ
jgi:hypothetical protein